MNQFSNELQDMIYLNWKGEENKFLAVFENNGLIIVLFSFVYFLVSMETTASIRL